MSEHKLNKAISSNDPGSQARWSFLELVGYGVGVANLPLGLVMIVGSMVADSVTRHQRQSEVPMPDAWLQEASESKGVSDKGLAYLARTLKKNGFVSVADAVEWAKIEKRESEKLKKQAEKDSGLSQTGAQALLERANNQCSDLFDVSGALSSLREGTLSATNYTKSLFGSKKEPSSEQ